MKKKETGELIGKSITPNQHNKIIMGIDPGLQFLGIGIIEIDPQIFTTIEINKKKQIYAKSLLPLITQYTHYFLKIKQNRETSEKLYFIHRSIDDLITQYQPDSIIIEDSFVGFNKSSSIKIGLSRGSILSAIGKHAKTAEIIAPKQIKMEITQKGTATKEEIEIFFEQNLENWQHSEKLDSSDALAAAFCGIKNYLQKT